MRKIGKATTCAALALALATSPVWAEKMTKKMTVEDVLPSLQEDEDVCAGGIAGGRQSAEAKGKTCACSAGAMFAAKFLFAAEIYKNDSAEMTPKGREIVDAILAVCMGKYLKTSTVAAPPRSR